MTVYFPIEQSIGKPAIPPATQYGYALDYLYAVNDFDEDGAMGSNIARRACWPVQMYIYARKFTEDEIEAQGTAIPPLPHGVFIMHPLGGEQEYDPTNDMQATDWQIGTRI